MYLVYIFYAYAYPYRATGQQMCQLSPALKIVMILGSTMWHATCTTCKQARPQKRHIISVSFCKNKFDSFEARASSTQL